ncbi:YceH family protein [Granulicella tundricola]|uniref:Uncharacterized protein n=1 Tax=Granulicella tundricola (strain ATCC BAA-1859 / DSM 23138 / MP5ACTX9) TaxID=1198114 RepID=E8WW58_GRATM|nr:YceH family protein [Granulicella tundricola]ADW67364.1 protein of unknown function DUF480 [Granulicella tundricola MP5ACTX9]
MADALKLTPESLRVLGALMEKEMTTPENYPLSLNALIGACNQKTSREPVMEFTEDAVRGALDALEIHELISTAHDSRVPKYEHRIRTVLNLRRDETAVLCLLILRGPQTTGELRGRSDRMFSFDDTIQVQSTLDRLAARETPLVAVLPRQPGSSASRSAHLLGDVAQTYAAAAAPAAPNELSVLRERLAELELRVAALESMQHPAHEES